MNQPSLFNQQTQQTQNSLFQNQQPNQQAPSLFNQQPNSLFQNQNQTQPGLATPLFQNQQQTNPQNTTQPNLFNQPNQAQQNQLNFQQNNLLNQNQFNQQANQLPKFLQTAQITNNQMPLQAQDNKIYYDRDFEQNMNSLYQYTNINDLQSNQFLFRLPVYNEIPKNVDKSYFQNNNQYIPLMDHQLWVQQQSKNPNPNQYYVYEIYGFEQLNQRYQQYSKEIQDNMDALMVNTKHIKEMKSTVNSLMKDKITQLQERNHSILDRVYRLLNIIEKLAIKNNCFQRNNNAQMVLNHRQSDIEKNINALNSQLQEIKIKTQKQKLNCPNLNSDHQFIKQSKNERQKNTIQIMCQEMKLAVENMNNFHQKYNRELKILKKHIQNNPDLF